MTSVVDEGAPEGRDVVRLDNRFCSYCSAELRADASDVDHVIGRRFVPRGVLNGQWNLLVRSCLACNREKAALEDTISAHSMHIFGHDDRTRQARLLEEHRRKAMGSSGPRKDRELRRMTISASPFPGAQFDFHIVAPAQPPRDALARLAEMQYTAFFFWLSYDQQQSRGQFWTGGFHLADWRARPDWGNVRQKNFMSTVAGWEPVFEMHTASGYFRAIVRASPLAPVCSWALEWNTNYRLVGFLGDEPQVSDMANSLPEVELKRIPVSEGELRFGLEHPLSSVDDSLFTDAHGHEPPSTERSG